MRDRIQYSRASVVGSELAHIKEAIDSGRLAGDGDFTKRCEVSLAGLTGGGKVLLTSSCTAALEMAALLLDLGPGDEVVMPSFAFSSIANAVVLRGGVPVFVDIDASTLNIDPGRVAAAITGKTRAIFVVHYAGVVADMTALRNLAVDHGLALVEDAAHALGATCRDKPAGSFGDLAAFSFHDTKNVVSGEGGCLVVNRADLVSRAEIIREKGTNRAAFFRGEARKYSWVDVGSSYLMSELSAAFLLGQIEKVRLITEKRREMWAQYHAGLCDLEERGLFRLPHIPSACDHNGHIFYLLMANAGLRARFIDDMEAAGIWTPFHFVPLHSAPAGRRYARTAGPMDITDDVAARLVRLPIHLELGDGIDRVIDVVREWVASVAIITPDATSAG